MVVGCVAVQWMHIVWRYGDYRLRVDAMVTSFVVTNLGGSDVVCDNPFDTRFNDI